MFVLERRRRNRARRPRRARKTRAAATPMPALAPVERPEEVDFRCVADVVGVAVAVSTTVWPLEFVVVLRSTEGEGVGEEWTVWLSHTIWLVIMGLNSARKVEQSMRVTLTVLTVNAVSAWMSIAFLTEVRFGINNLLPR